MSSRNLALGSSGVTRRAEVACGTNQRGAHMFQRIPAPLPGDQAPRPISEVRQVDQAAGGPPDRRTAGELPKARRVDEIAISREAEDRLLREDQSRAAATQRDGTSSLRERPQGTEARERTEGIQARERPEGVQTREGPEGPVERERPEGPAARERVDRPEARAEQAREREVSRSRPDDGVRTSASRGEATDRSDAAPQRDAEGPRAPREVATERINERIQAARADEETRTESRQDVVAQQRAVVEERGIGGDAPRGVAAVDEATRIDNQAADRARRGEADTFEVERNRDSVELVREDVERGIERQASTERQIESEARLRSDDVAVDERSREGSERVAAERSEREAATRDGILRNRLDEARAVRPSDSRSVEATAVRGDDLDRLRESAARQRVAAQAESRPNGAMGEERQDREVKLPFPDGGRTDFGPDAATLLEELDGRPDPPESTLPEELFG
ncbi:hypothetical protein [Engelhardtia mirabilis]|uniref:hypothetical protein n=1 Tax=Engelhardtia mirabilis TaxID=2528011 RepID=UPI0011A9E832